LRYPFDPDFLSDLPHCGALGYIAPQKSVECCGAGAQRSGVMKYLRKYTAIPAVKYSLIAIASLLWLIGFAEQLPDVAQTAKYVGISLLMLAVAAMA